MKTLSESPTQPMDPHAALLRENARLRGDLLTVARRISHDLRTPLGGVVTTTEILKELLAENDSAHAALVDPIINSTEDLSRLIDRVSFLLKATVNPLPAARVKMGDPVFNALERLESRIIKSGATVVQPSAWPAVHGVAAWLEVVWGNLLANALQHGKKPARIELGWRQDHGGFRFWASDDGAGVPEEKIPGLFHPFHSLHEPDAPSGLGLAIVQRLVELQGGQCGYEPRGETGPVFYFTLPA